MKKKILSLFFALSLTASALFAQNAETVVPEVLAAMPAQDATAFAREMSKLAAAAPRSVQVLASCLQPASEGKNSPVEYALSGVVAYVSDPANAALRPVVLEGLTNAIEACNDKVNKAFLQSQARLLGQEPQVEVREDQFPIASALMNTRSPKQIGKMVVAALQDGDRPYANALLGYADELVGPQAIAGPVGKAFKKLPAEGKADVLNWIGRNRIASLRGLVNKGLSLPGEAGEAAVRAAALLGGDDFAARLMSLLQQDGPLAQAAYGALKAFNGDIRPVLGKMLAAEESPALVLLAGERRLTGSANRIFALLDNENTHGAALEALSGVVVPTDAARVSQLLDAAQEADVPPLQKALSAALHTLPAGEACNAVLPLLDVATKPARLYPVLAATGADAAIPVLDTPARAADAAAFDALLKMDNPRVAPVLLSLAETVPEFAGKALDRYVSLLSAYEPDPTARCSGLSRVLSLAKEAPVRVHAVRALADVPTAQAFDLASAWLDQAETAYAAARSVRAIASKCAETLDADALKSALAKAISIFAGTGDADDGYAVDELKKLLLAVENR